MNRSLKILALTLPVALCLADPDSVVAGSADGAHTGLTSKKEVDYTLDSPAGVAHLIVRPDTESLLFRIDAASNKPVAIATQAELIGSLLKQFLQENDHPSHLFVVFRDTSELFERIGDSAVRSTDWNGHTGRPRKGTVSSFIVQEINSNHLAHEFEDSFKAVGYVLRAKSAEQVIIGTAGPNRTTAAPVSGVFGFVAEKESAK
jgi:hypothetical protein